MHDLDECTVPEEHDMHGANDSDPDRYWTKGTP